MIVGVSGSDRFPSLSWETGHKMVIAVISVCCSADIAMHDVAEFVVLSVTWMYCGETAGHLLSMAYGPTLWSRPMGLYEPCPLLEWNGQGSETPTNWGALIQHVMLA